MYYLDIKREPRINIPIKEIIVTYSTFIRHISGAKLISVRLFS